MTREEVLLDLCETIAVDILTLDIMESHSEPEPDFPKIINYLRKNISETGLKYLIKGYKEEEVDKMCNKIVDSRTDDEWLDISYKRYTDIRELLS